jgi:hypothetical protein
MERDVAQFEVLLWNLLGMTEGNGTVSIVGIWADISYLDLPYMKPEG